jgi:hypothetical protein
MGDACAWFVGWIAHAEKKDRDGEMRCSLSRDDSFCLRILTDFGADHYNQASFSAVPTTKEPFS